MCRIASTLCHAYAGQLAQIERRIARAAADAAAASDDAIAYSALVEQSGSAYGCKAQDARELSWLDCPHLEPLDGGAGWKVQYHVCRMTVGHERQPAAAHTATLLPSADAPEGFVVAVQQ